MKKDEMVHPILRGCDDEFVQVYKEKGLDWKTIKKVEEYHDKVIKKIDKKLKAHDTALRQSLVKEMEGMIGEDDKVNIGLSGGDSVATDMDLVNLGKNRHRQEMRKKLKILQEKG